MYHKCTTFEKFYRMNAPTRNDIILWFYSIILVNQKCTVNNIMHLFCNGSQPASTHSECE